MRDVSGSSVFSVSVHTFVSNGLYIKVSLHYLLQRLPAITSQQVICTVLLKQLVAAERATAKGALMKLCGQLWYLMQNLKAPRRRWHIRGKDCGSRTIGQVTEMGPNRDYASAESHPISAC